MTSLLWRAEREGNQSVEDRATITTLKRQLRQTRRQLEQAEAGWYTSRRVESFIEDALETPPVTPDWVLKSGSPSSPSVGTSALSDIEYGEVVRPEEVFGLNEYDTAIAQERLRRYFEGIIRIQTEVMASVPFAGTVIFALGGRTSPGRSTRSCWRRTRRRCSSRTSV